MKKFFKIIAGLLIVIALILIIGYSFIAINGIPKYTAQQVTVNVQHTPQNVERGLRLASVLCIKCHTGNNSNQLTGRELFDIPPEFGKIYSANITQHADYGIGKWTDAQLVYFLRTGVKADGTYAPIWMPKFVKMSDEDLFSIVAYLRSSHPSVQPATAVSQKCEPSWLSKFLCYVAFKPLPYPESAMPEPDTNNLLAYGSYLVAGRYDCFPCHSADFKTVNVLEPEKSEGYLGGGNLLINEDRQPVYSANITMDTETGIGNYTFEQFAEALRFGKTPHGPIRYPMFPYTILDDLETKAIWTYLNSVPKIKNDVRKKYAETK
jgi:cytochrome c2